jgi:hypothetical protein
MALQVFSDVKGWSLNRIAVLVDEILNVLIAALGSAVTLRTIMRSKQITCAYFF